MPEWVTGSDWVNGDTLTEQRLDEMQGNADYLREEARHRIAAQSGAGGEIEGTSGTNYYWARLRLVIGGNTYTTEWVENNYASYPQEWAVALPRNQTLSGLSLDTKYDLEIYIDMGVTVGSATAYQIGNAAVYYIEDVSYLSTFATIAWTGPRTITIADLAIILTRDNEAL